MQLKALARKKLFIAILGGLIFFIVLTLYFILKSPARENTVAINTKVLTLHEENKIKSGIPIHITIPAIKVDAVINQVGLTTDGAMDVPKDPTSTAWFDLGPRPGDLGSAVIDGHFGWGNGIAAVFDNLDKLHKGEEIYVTDEKGIVTTFIIRDFRTYMPNADAGNVFSSNDGKAHLNLITCGGNWNKDQKSYSNRLVVFADKK